MSNSEEYKNIQNNDLIRDSETIRQIEFLESKTKELAQLIDQLEDEVKREVAIIPMNPVLDQLTERIIQVEAFVTERFPQYKSHIVSSNEESLKGNDQ